MITKEDFIFTKRFQVQIYTFVSILYIIFNMQKQKIRMNQIKKKEKKQKKVHKEKSSQVNADQSHPSFLNIFTPRKIMLKVQPRGETIRINLVQLYKKFHLRNKKSKKKSQKSLLHLFSSDFHPSSTTLFYTHVCKIIKAVTSHQPRTPPDHQTRGF